jgi:transcriptional regulator with XRE-family HTH domain
MAESERWQLDQIDDPTGLASQLDRLRVRAAMGTGRVRLSVRDIAKATGIPKSTLAGYLSGKTSVPADLLAKIALALGATPEEAAQWERVAQRLAEGNPRRTARDGRPLSARNQADPPEEVDGTGPGLAASGSASRWSTWRVALVAAALTVVAVAFALVASADGTPTKDPTVAASPWFYLTPMHVDGKCLSVHKSGRADNAEVRQFDCLGQPNQQFRRLTRETGEAVLQIRHSGKCLTVYQESKADGAIINQFSCLWQDNQIWADDDGLWRVRHTNKCISINDSSKANNARAIQWPCRRDDPSGRFRSPTV